MWTREWMKVKRGTRSFAWLSHILIINRYKSETYGVCHVRVIKLCV